MDRLGIPQRSCICRGKTGGIIETLSGLTIGSLTLDPTFDDEETEYTATTTNNSNKVTATATDEDATITITLDGEEIENESSPTWEVGDNVLVIEVSRPDTFETHYETTVYTVTVTKSAL